MASICFQCNDCQQMIELDKPELVKRHFFECSSYQLSCMGCRQTFNRITLQHHDCPSVKHTVDEQPKPVDEQPKPVEVSAPRKEVSTPRKSLKGLNIMKIKSAEAPWEKAIRMNEERLLSTKRKLDSSSFAVDNEVKSSVPKLMKVESSSSGFAYDNKAGSNLPKVKKLKKLISSVLEENGRRMDKRKLVKAVVNNLVGRKLVEGGSIDRRELKKIVKQKVESSSSFAVVKKVKNLILSVLEENGGRMNKRKLVNAVVDTWIEKNLVEGGSIDRRELMKIVKQKVESSSRFRSDSDHNVHLSKEY